MSFVRTKMLNRSFERKYKLQRFFLNLSCIISDEPTIPFFTESHWALCLAKLDYISNTGQFFSWDEFSTQDKLFLKITYRWQQAHCKVPCSWYSLWSDQWISLCSTLNNRKTFRYCRFLHYWISGMLLKIKRTYWRLSGINSISRS